MWRGALIVVVIALFHACISHAANTNTIICAGATGTVGEPVYVFLKQSGCFAAGTGGRPVWPGATNELYCPGSVSSQSFMAAQWAGGAITACTENVLDTTTDMGPGV